MIDDEDDDADGHAQADFLRRVRAAHPTRCRRDQPGENRRRQALADDQSSRKQARPCAARIPGWTSAPPTSRTDARAARRPGSARSAPSAGRCPCRRRAAEAQPRLVALSSSSMMTTTTPIPAPKPIRPQSRLPPSTPWAIAEISAACGAARELAVRRGALEAESGVEEVEHRRNDRRAEDDAEHQRHLLPPRRRVDQLAGLQILEVVVGDRRNAENHAVTNNAKATSDFDASPLDVREQRREDQGDAEHRQDADARNRAVRRADQAGHVAGHRGDHDARDRGCRRC